MRHPQPASAQTRRPTGRHRGPRGKSSSLPTSLPRAEKRKAGRTEAAQVPAFIRTVGVELSDDDRAYTRRKLGMKLGKFASSIERVSVRVADVNGPRGGVDQVCRVKVVLSGLPSVVFENKNASLHPAIDGAVTGVERAVRRTLQRRRMKPLRRPS